LNDGFLTGIVDLPRAGINGLEQLIDLLVGHLLAEVRQDVLELTNTNKACHVLVKDLETTTVLLGLAGVAEAAGAVQNALEGLEVDCVLISGVSHRAHRQKLLPPNMERKGGSRSATYNHLQHSSRGLGSQRG
jgi:hypothetical protein